MKSNLPQMSATFAKVLLTYVMVFACAQAQEITTSKGYLGNSKGDIVRSVKSQDCVRTSDWAAETTMLEGCNGVVLLMSTMFAFDSAELTSDGKAALEKQRDTLKPKFAAAYAGVIVGHADSQGDPNYNIELSKLRAQTVRDYLLGEGAKANKISVSGRGATDPIASNATRKGRAMNRRVEIIFIDEEQANK